MHQKNITIRDVGPIEALTIPLPEIGGLVVLRGGQGVGKTTALKAISKSLGAGKVKGLESRDGARRGVLELGDVKLTVTKSRSTRKGELEVAELESRADLSVLVDPGIDDPERADAARIKSLVSLCGVKADPSPYWQLLGGRSGFDQLGVNTETSDPVDLAGRVKRALEAVARQREMAAESESGHAKACAEQIAGLDLHSESDESVLAGRYDLAKSRHTKLLEQQRLAREDQQRREKAKQKLAEAKSLHAGPDLAQASASRQDAEGLVQEISQKVSDLEKQLIDARVELDKRNRELLHSREIEQAASDHARAMEGWQAAIEASPLVIPSDTLIQRAQTELEAAKLGMSMGVRVRDGLVAKERQQQHEAECRKLRAQAERLRDAAKSVDDILSQTVQSGLLRIYGGRLVTATDRSESELFADLSRGEQWKLAIDIACEQLAESGLLCIPQEAFEGLQPANRQVIHEHAVSRGVVILTAQATDGGLSASIYRES